MIEVADLAFTYPKAPGPAIKGLSFAVGRGEVFGFLGPSGAGKSTSQNGPIPTYWPVKAFWDQQAGGHGYPAYLLVGAAYQALLLVPLLRRFDRVTQA